MSHKLGMVEWCSEHSCVFTFFCLASTQKQDIQNLNRKWRLTCRIASIVYKKLLVYQKMSLKWPHFTDKFVLFQISNLSNVNKSVCSRYCAVTEICIQGRLFKKLGMTSPRGVDCMANSNATTSVQFPRSYPTSSRSCPPGWLVALYTTKRGWCTFWRLLNNGGWEDGKWNASFSYYPHNGAKVFLKLFVCLTLTALVYLTNPIFIALY